MSGGRGGRCDEVDDPLGRERHGRDRDPVVAQRVLDRGRDRGRDGDRAGLTGALDPQGVARRRRLEVDDRDVRHVGGTWQAVVHERAVEELAVVGVDELLVEGATETLDDASDDLALEDARVDDPAAVVRDDVSLDPDVTHLGIDRDQCGMDAVREGDHGRKEHLGGPQPG